LGIETAHPRKHRSPALVCASWSDHGLHTRGSIEGFERISSKQKWLFTHGRKKWETFYGDEALAWQNRFLDHFLRDLDNGMDQVPRVRLEIRKAFYQQGVRSEESWPLPSVQPMRLYLCASTGSLQAEPLSSEGNVRYQSTSRNGKAVFSYRFERPMELIGSMRLKLWVSTSEGDDLDLFVVLKKREPSGREVFFSGFNGYEKDAVAKGWLRVSHREVEVIAQPSAAPVAQARSLAEIAP
jgi:predicted acyl esterase